MPSLFSLSNPPSLFQYWFVVCLYLLPLVLYSSWAALSLMDLSDRADGGSLGWSVLVLLVPLLGAAAYLLGFARTYSPRARRAIVIAGLLVWLVPLAAGVWLAGGPLGPKALS